MIQNKSVVALIVLMGMFFTTLSMAAIEGKSTETDAALDRDESGVILDPGGSAFRRIPDDRNMSRVQGAPSNYPNVIGVSGNNVVKAEEKDKYTNRIMMQIKKELTERMDLLDNRVSTMELAVHQIGNEVKRATPRKAVSKIEADISTAKATSTATSTTTTII